MPIRLVALFLLSLFNTFDIYGAGLHFSNENMPFSLLENISIEEQLKTENILVRLDYLTKEKNFSETIFNISDLSTDEITDLEEMLKYAGYYTKIDGEYDDDAKVKFESFLYDRNLELNYTGSVFRLLEKIKKENAAIIDDNYDFLVSRDKHIPMAYIPNLVEVNVPKSGDIMLEEKAAYMLEKMFAAAKKEGLNLHLVSGYRSSQEQQELYWKIVDQRGLDYANNLVAIPGTSEHQTGLAIDIAARSTIRGSGVLFENTREFKWVSENVAEYGFILRYRYNREEETGYRYEPWHYRFIGDVELAKQITQNKLILEDLY